VARRLRRSAAIGAAALALAAAGCGADDEAPEEAQPVGDTRAGSVAQLAECSDWTAGSRDERVATVEVIKAAINLEDGTGETPELSDEAAYRLLEDTCAHDFAGSFRLYKVYARATSFASFAD
jgi:hypothetical protein